MKRSIVLLFVVLVFASLGYAGDVYLANNSPALIRPETSADAIFMSELRKLIPHYSDMRLVSETANLDKWQQQQHGNNDLLLEFNCETLGDGNGVGPEGKHIEIIAFSIWITEGGKSRSSGSAVTWFRIDNSLQSTTSNAHDAANAIAYQLKTMSREASRRNNSGVER